MSTAEAGTAPGGPVRAAQESIEADHLGRYDVACAMTDPRLRLARAQAWIWNNRKDDDIRAVNRDELATAMAAERPEHPLWDDFAATELHQMREVYGRFQPDSWGATSGPSAAGPGYALVLFAQLSSEPLMLTEQSQVFSLAFLMHAAGPRWVLAAFADNVPRPGWPPKF
jgi:hypothetical protein